MNNNINLTMLADFYEFTMANGYFTGGMADKTAVFDMFFRKVPDDGGFAIFAGLEQLIDYINGLRFDAEDIEFLRGKGIFDEKFLEYLSNFKFTSDVWAMREGTPVFPGEPLLIVRGPIIEAQFIETMILLSINHQSLIATKANRVVRAADGRAIIEFGSRRAQGYNAAVYGARAAFIGGCAATSCSVCEQRYGIPVSGTMAHSWVQLFDSEYEAFHKYAEIYPSNCVLLIDTYNVLKSGLPNAIKVFNEVVLPSGNRPGGVRIDSGDITYLSKKIWQTLDDAGFSDCPIIASNSLDEVIIKDTLAQGAKIDVFGVGERLITSRSEPVFGGIYKMVACRSDGGGYTPKIKLSENVNKITTPGFKKVYRLVSRDNDKAIADVVTNYDEVIDDGKPYEIFDPEYTWKRKLVTDFYAHELLAPVFLQGKCVYNCPPLSEVKAYCMESVDMLWDEVRRFENPHKYYVDLSEKLWNIKEDLLKKY